MPIEIQIPAWMLRKSAPRKEADGRSAHKIVVIDGKPVLALNTEKPKKEEVKTATNK